MNNKLNIYETDIDKASHLREINILQYEKFSKDKIRLVLNYKDKFPVKNLNEKPYRINWIQGKEAENHILNSNSVIFLGILNNNFYFSICEESYKFSENLYFDLRTLNPMISNEDLSFLNTSRGISYWHSKNLFCSICGLLTKFCDYGHSRLCTNDQCQNKIFPRLDPAVIMLITYNNSCLLGRQKVWPKGMHSTLAGFVEHGETIEQAVARETLEEAGVKIKNIQYKYSQPWPFPSSLMLGFHAEAYDDNLKINYEELENAQWFSKEFIKSSPENETFKLPGKISIARRLITDWISE